MSTIHPTAVIDPRAEIGAEVHIGPFCVIGPDVVIGDRCRLHSHVTVTGRTVLGPGNELYPGVVLGAAPQDLKYRGGRTELIVGRENVFREYVTVHPGTEVAGGRTVIGNYNHLLVGVHIAHDCVIADGCVIANYVQIAGHVHIEERCHIGGVAAFHHFVTVGKYAYVGGMARVTQDVVPFMVTQGYPARVRSVNEEGMRRWGFDDQALENLRYAFRVLYGRRSEASGLTMLERIAALETDGHADENVRYLCEFIRRATRDGVYGRYRESLRKDAEWGHGEFYARYRNGPEGES